MQVESVMQLLYNSTMAKDGLFPTNWDSASGEPTYGDITVGASSDSAYEYMLKQYLLSEGTDTHARHQCMYIVK